MTPASPPVVTPVKTRNTPDLGPVSVMAATSPDYQLLKHRMGLGDCHTRPLYTGSLTVGKGRMRGLSLCGPFIGAPHAVMVLETLVAWGVERIVFTGWCGAVSPDVRIGDMVLPTGAIVDEGTSLHYGQKRLDLLAPSAHLLEKTRYELKRRRAAYHEGLVWTTDAAFRETPEKVRFFQTRQTLVVEMELSALLSVGRFHEADVSGLLVVSDELSSLTWKPGFKDRRFKEGRTAVADIVTALAEALV